MATSTKSESKDIYPVRLDIVYPDQQSRLLALTTIPFFVGRLILLLPVLILVYLAVYLGFILAWVNALVVLVTGSSPKELHKFMVGMLRFSTRMTAYMYGLTDKYPPFRLDN